MDMHNIFRISERNKFRKKGYGILLSIQVLILALIVFLIGSLGISNSLLIGLIMYVVISVFLKTIIPVAQNRGSKYCRRGQFDLAIKEFRISYDFFQRYQWLDKYRAIFLMSLSTVSYVEAALLNMAYCYGKLGSKQKSKEIYERVLFEYPGSELAMNALKNFNT